ncbi:hypothetical protein C8R44DRAFT_724678 [Mycena epipterygia]|nr:hypothetical protein C8R44DRAFT_724678 [Mycena epipterygia]
MSHRRATPPPLLHPQLPTPGADVVAEKNKARVVDEASWMQPTSLMQATAAAHATQPEFAFTMCIRLRTQLRATRKSGTRHISRTEPSGAGSSRVRTTVEGGAAYRRAQVESYVKAQRRGRSGHEDAEGGAGIDRRGHRGGARARARSTGAVRGRRREEGRNRGGMNAGSGERRTVTTRGGADVGANVKNGAAGRCGEGRGADDGSRGRGRGNTGRAEIYNELGVFGKGNRKNDNALSSTRSCHLREVGSRSPSLSSYDATSREAGSIMPRMSQDICVQVSTLAAMSKRTSNTEGGRVDAASLAASMRAGTAPLRLKIHAFIQYLYATALIRDPNQS